MKLAPPRNLRACLEVLYLATLKARALGWSGEREGLSAERSARLGELMDAVHNLPSLVQNWDACNEEHLRAMLRDYDARWKDGESLLAHYDRVVADES